jgi:hypothetical protein
MNVNTLERENWMSSTASSLPIELMRSDAKYRVIEYIRGLGLPSRFARQMLQDWGEAVGVDLDGTAYELVSTPAKSVGL